HRPAGTRSKRVKRTDPGAPDGCNISHLHKAFSPPATVAHVAEQCSTAGWGCLDCKRVLHGTMMEELVPIQARAKELSAKPSLISDALAAGTEKCKTIARETMKAVREEMGIAW